MSCVSLKKKKILQLVHKYVHSVLQQKCRPGNARRSLLERLPASGHVTQPFLGKDAKLPDDLFLFPPPFGFRGLRDKLEDVLTLVGTIYCMSTVMISRRDSGISITSG